MDVVRTPVSRLRRQCPVGRAKRGAPQALALLRGRPGPVAVGAAPLHPRAAVRLVPSLTWTRCCAKQPSGIVGQRFVEIKPWANVDNLFIFNLALAAGERVSWRPRHSLRRLLLRWRLLGADPRKPVL